MQTKVVTVRMSEEIYALLHEKSFEESISINRICLAAIRKAINQSGEYEVHIIDKTPGRSPVLDEVMYFHELDEALQFKQQFNCNGGTYDAEGPFRDGVSC